MLPKKKEFLEQAKEKLALLRDKGPTAQAFTFKNTFPPAGEVKTGQASEFDDLFPGT